MGDSTHDPTPPRTIRWRRLVLAILLAVLVPAGAAWWRGWSPFAEDAPPPPTPAPALTLTVPVEDHWPDDVPSTPYAAPARIKNVLSTRGAQHGYQFAGTAGQQWALTVEPWASALDPLVIVYGPDGDILARADDQPGGGLTAHLRIDALPATGPYRVLVRSSQGGNTTGAYILTLLVR
jgi:hypothetical protein